MHFLWRRLFFLILKSRSWNWSPNPHGGCTTSGFVLAVQMHTQRSEVTIHRDYCCSLLWTGWLIMCGWTQITHTLWRYTAILEHTHTHTAVSPVVESPAGDVNAASMILCACVSLRLCVHVSRLGSARTPGCEDLISSRQAGLKELVCVSCLSSVVESKTPIPPLSVSVKCQTFLLMTHPVLVGYKKINVIIEFGQIHSTLRPPPHPPAKKHHPRRTWVISVCWCVMKTRLRDNSRKFLIAWVKVNRTIVFPPADVF